MARNRGVPAPEIIFGDHHPDDAVDAGDTGRIRTFLANLVAPRRGIWLDDLADVLRAAGLQVVEVDGWRTRSRKTGGFDQILGTVWHHTASPASANEAAAVDYMAKRAEFSPICNVGLGRTGICYVSAAGACNHAGKGGPYPAPPARAWLAQDRANTTMLSVEQFSAGDGVEVWPAAQIEASLILRDALTDRYVYPDDHNIAHKEWCGPRTSTPGRKIDPLGEWHNDPAGLWAPGSDWGPGQGTIAGWRNTPSHHIAPEPEPPVEVHPDPEEDDMAKVAIYTVENVDSAGRPTGSNVDAQFIAMVTGGPNPVALHFEWTGPGSDPKVQARVAAHKAAGALQLHCSMNDLANISFLYGRNGLPWGDRFHTWKGAEFADVIGG